MLRFFPRWGITINMLSHTLKYCKMKALKYWYIFEYWNLTFVSTTFFYLSENSKDKMTSASPEPKLIQTSLPGKCALWGSPADLQDSLHVYKGQASAHICKGHGETSFKRKQHFGSVKFRPMPLYSVKSRQCITHARTHTYTHTHTHIHTHTHTHTHTYTHIQRQTHTHTHTPPHRDRHTHTHTHRVANHWKKLYYCVINAITMLVIWASSMVLNVKLYYCIISSVRQPLYLHKCLEIISALSSILHTPLLRRMWPHPKGKACLK